MKDNISIIFAALILTFLIIIMPLFSILDRQDTMSYNLVLSETTKFVDEVRSNGFLTQDAYNDYLTALATTGNTYKVVIEAYRKTLIPDGDHKYKEVRELYNTKDIEEIISGVVADTEKKEANKRDNIFLFDLNDEFYVHVYNTNTTSGTIMYNLLLTNVESKIIDITYGGMINNVNWELYTKLKSETIVYPKVILSVPTNAEGSINIEQLVANDVLKSGKCTVEAGSELEDLFAGVERLCRDVIEEETYKYVYRLDETNDSGAYVNQTIKLVAKLDGVDMLDVSDSTNGTRYENLSTITELSTDVKEAIIQKYIRLNGMTANINIDKLVRNNDNYYIYLTLTNVQRETTANIAVIASVSILPGLGRDNENRLTLAEESVKFELTMLNLPKEATITGPYNWKQFQKTNIAEESLLTHVFADEEIFYKIQYNISNLKSEDVLKLVNQEISFMRQEGTIWVPLDATGVGNYMYSIAYFTEKDLYDDYNLTVESNTVIVKLTYNANAVEKTFRITLPENWLGIDNKAIATDPIYIYGDYEGPNDPIVDFIGNYTKNGWYNSNVGIRAYSTTDNGPKVNGQMIASGVYKNWVKIDEYGVPRDADSNIDLTDNGEYNIYVYSEDYAGNRSATTNYEINIDKELPTAPNLQLIGTKRANGWYESEVKVTITRGEDSVSGVDKTVYKVNEMTGTNNILDTSIGKNKTTSFTLDESGTYTIYATTYDNAGNKTTTKQEVNIDLGTPPTSRIEILSGLKHTEDAEWYYTNVKLRVHINLTMSTHSKESGYILYKDGVWKESDTIIGTTKDFVLEETGTYTLRIGTKTVSGSIEYQDYIIKIDKEGPTVPKVTINGTKGLSDWYKSDVDFVLNTVENDAANKYSYILTDNINGDVKKAAITLDNSIYITNEGRYTLRVIASDAAGNEVAYETEINIDKTAPTGKLHVSGTNGLGEIYTEGNVSYYNSAVYVSAIDKEDNLSGISGRTTSRNATILDSTNGSVLSQITIYDVAGNENTLTTNIVVDRIAPTKGEINISGGEVDEITTGVKSYDAIYSIGITAGRDDNFYYSTYTLSNSEGTISEGTIDASGTTISVDFDNSKPDGIYTVIVTTVDKAGNKTSNSKVFMVDKKEPPQPEIVEVNGQRITSNGQTVYGARNFVRLKILSTENYDIIVDVDGKAINYTEENSSQAGEKIINFSITETSGTEIAVKHVSKAGWISESFTITYVVRNQTGGT